mmetsp:Transcript_45481/g.120985  ORF Transcript_45481/g.120985 Transcript_45481/m.120985 type:complete len:206 (+) Transcript_45481:133-750(+)
MMALPVGWALTNSPMSCSAIDTALLSLRPPGLMISTSTLSTCASLSSNLTAFFSQKACERCIGVHSSSPDSTSLQYSSKLDRRSTFSDTRSSSRFISDTMSSSAHVRCFMFSSSLCAPQTERMTFMSPSSMRLTRAPRIIRITFSFCTSLSAWVSTAASWRSASLGLRSGEKESSHTQWQAWYTSWMLPDWVLMMGRRNCRPLSS